MIVKVICAVWLCLAVTVALNFGQAHADQRITSFKDCPDCPDMVVIPAGSFMMGSDNWRSQQPRHDVTVNSFAIGKFLVTHAQFEAFVDETGYQAKGCSFKKASRVRYAGQPGLRPLADWREPGFDQTEKDPVVCVSYTDAKAYVRWLNKKVRAGIGVSAGQDGPSRLPTEAEWEYAARGGTTTDFWWGKIFENGKALCNRCGSQWDASSTAPVGSFAPNPFGLYDVSGNADEWVDDCWHENYEGAPRDGSAWSVGDCKVHPVRGGSWPVNPVSLRVSERTWLPDSRENYVGFRVARAVP
jgi:formylglycine-generating enzyme required for sulfatase activity